MAAPVLQTGVGARFERWLEAERDALPLWIPVLFGLGIACWFVAPARGMWLATLCLGLGAAVGGLVLPLGGRSGRALLIGGLALAGGVTAIWWRAERVAAPVLARPAIAQMTARVEAVQPLVARDLVRLRLAPIGDATLPPVVRVNVAEGDVPAGVTAGAIVRLRARLMPPPGPAVPGAYDYARVAWFDGVGATGRAFGPVTVIRPGSEALGSLRNRLAAHIRGRIDGAAGGVAASLATGDQGGIPEEDAEALRRAGLAHLLSVSGLHITAVVGATMVLVLRLLALWPWAALNLRLPLIAAGAAALAAIGYTLLTGAEVPTIRSCVAALLVLGALALGREAVTLRLVAAGAAVVMIVRPESIVGASFQLSFAAVTAIVALYESRWLRDRLGKREEGWARGLARGTVLLLVTGVAVEIALMPIGLYHFHKAGLYGALANIVAIPLTTFVIMPLEAGALLLDALGLGAPLWWLCGQALALLLWIAQAVAAAPGAVAALPSMPTGAFAAMAAGGLWIALWRTRARWAGVVPLAIGAGWALATPPPDLIVTRDGRHLAIRTGDGGMAVLRERAGDYVRSVLAEGGGIEGELPAIDDMARARCNRDLCAVTVAGGWRVLATRSGHLVDPLPLIAECRAADVVVSDRRLPRGCTPRWLRLDRPVLVRTGGVAVGFMPPRVSTAAERSDHPWHRAERVAPPRLPRPDARATVPR